MPSPRLSPASGPRISVILVFGDPRGRPEHLTSWTRKQTLPAEQFEVIAITTASHAGMAEDLRGQLRPHDQVIVGTSDIGAELYGPAIAAARGELLFFSEDHCVARPDCLAGAVRYMDAHGEIALASVPWGHISRTEVARLEQRAFEQLEQVWASDDHWYRVHFRGFVIRRAALDAVGGFEARYDLFAEAALAARLHRAGHRMDYAREGGTLHVNTTDFAELYQNIENFARHECLFCDEQDPELCERYFGGTLQFLAERHQAEGCPRSLQASFWLREWSGEHRVLARQSLARLAREALAQTIPRRWRARWERFQARARIAWWRGDADRRFAAFLDLWSRCAEVARADYAAEHPRAPLRLASTPPGFAAGPAVDVYRATGLHVPETYHGRGFCWTAPEAALWLGLSPGDCEIVLETGPIGFGPDPHRPLGIFWNGRRISPDKIERSATGISFRVGPGDFSAEPAQRLTLVMGPLASPGDPRRLGLPLFSLACRAGDESARRAA